MDDFLIKPYEYLHLFPMNLPIAGTAPPFPSSVLTAAWVYSSALSSFAGLQHGVPPDLPPAVPLQHQVQQAASGLRWRNGAQKKGGEHGTNVAKKNAMKNYYELLAFIQCYKDLPCLAMMTYHAWPWWPTMLGHDVYHLWQYRGWFLIGNSMLVLSGKASWQHTAPFTYPCCRDDFFGWIWKGVIWYDQVSCTSSGHVLAWRYSTSVAGGHRCFKPNFKLLLMLQSKFSSIWTHTHKWIKT